MGCEHRGPSVGSVSTGGVSDVIIAQVGDCTATCDDRELLICYVQRQARSTDGVTTSGCELTPAGGQADDVQTMSSHYVQRHAA